MGDFFFFGIVGFEAMEKKVYSDVSALIAFLFFHFETTHIVFSRDRICPEQFCLLLACSCFPFVT